MEESETLELKETTAQLKASLKSISAILNKHQKGELYFGIDDKTGKAKGQEVSDKTLRSVGEVISQKIEPRIYGGLTIERIKKEEVSERRNELLAEMFHQIHFVERWGRGISLILSKESETGFKEVGRQFIVKFKRKPPTFETTQKTTQKILALIKENPRITRHELAKTLGISPDGVKYHLNNLKKEGILKRIGGRKEGYWKIIK